MTDDSLCFNIEALMKSKKKKKACPNIPHQASLASCSLRRRRRGEKSVEVRSPHVHSNKTRTRRGGWGGVGSIPNHLKAIIGPVAGSITYIWMKW